MSSQSPLPRGAGQHRLHSRRSHNGCLTCKRRKVRCNEQRPQCYHCQRLNLECEWKHAGPQRPSPPKRAGAGDPPESNLAGLGAGWPSPLPVGLFDFANSGMDPIEDFSLLQDIYLPECGDLAAPDHIQHDRLVSMSPSQDALRSPHTTLLQTQHPPSRSLIANTEMEDSLLLHTPPILDPVENGPICASLRALFDSMAASSPMVRNAIAAFATIQSHTSRGKVDYLQYYDKAANELSERFLNPGGRMSVSSHELRYVLTAIFFLTYANFLTGRLDLAYLNLAKAHSALQSAGGGLGSVEQRIISWLRLSDARAALAGGDGLFINDTSIYPSSPSSTSSSSLAQSTGPAANSGSHEVIYDMLCQPGIAFFQEVQTITGRITKIAHHHRSRGSVEDETEVMAIAADILKDLASLYDQRPALMDHAVSGNINTDTLAEQLASAIIRSFRTYVANFYVCYIHLHRVAHRHLPRPKVVNTALSKIKEIMHLMVNSSEYIPVNMLWPLFLWGSEEDDQDECQWILETIRSLQHVVSNASMAADVLQEIQRRQRAVGSRVDIRSVCLEMFNCTFVII